MEAESKEPVFDLEAAAEDAIAACQGDPRQAVKSLVEANLFLAKELEFAWRQASTGYARRRPVQEG